MYTLRPKTCPFPTSVLSIHFSDPHLIPCSTTIFSPTLGCLVTLQTSSRMDNHEMKYSEKKLRKIKMSGFFFFAKHATKNLCDDHQKNSHQIGKRVLLVDPNQSLRQQKKNLSNLLISVVPFIHLAWHLRKRWCQTVCWRAGVGAHQLKGLERN
jgi:hypothetical protein